MNYFFFYFYLFSYYYFRQKYKNITYNYLGRDNMKDLFIENYISDKSHIFNILKKKINENTFNEVLKLYNMYIKRK